MEKGYVWKKGDASVKGVLETDGDTVKMFKKHSAKGQWGDNKDGSATCLGFTLDVSKVSKEELSTGYAEWWVINRFRRHSGILDTDPTEAIRLFDGATFDASVDCLPPEGERKGNPDERAISALIKAGFSREDAELIIRKKDLAMETLSKTLKDKQWDSAHS